MKHLSSSSRWIAALGLLSTSGMGWATDPMGASERPAHTSLRCWQDGKIILDEAGWGLPTANLPGQVIKLKSLKGDEDALYLFDLNRAICMLKRQD
jgi:hypothetical protein